MTIFPPGSSRHEHSGGSDGASFSLAERIRGTADWLDSKRMPGSHDRAQRVLVANHPALLFSLLQTIKNSFGPRERCAGATSSSPSRIRGYCGTAGGRWTPPSVRAPCRLSSFWLGGWKASVFSQASMQGRWLLRVQSRPTLDLNLNVFSDQNLDQESIP